MGLSRGELGSIILEGLGVVVGGLCGEFFKKGVFKLFKVEDDEEFVKKLDTKKQRKVKQLEEKEI